LHLLLTLTECYFLLWTQVLPRMFVTPENL
jgi:hypothetical protein